MDDGKKVWVPHALDGYKLGRIVDIGMDGVTVELQERPPGQKMSASFDSTYPADEYDNKDVDDNCKNSITDAPDFLTRHRSTVIWARQIGANKDAV